MLLSIIIFILILGFLIFIHEFGHFIVAKKAGVKVEEFGFGFPPRILGKKKGETIYSINAIPLGGFVKLYGEDETDQRVLTDPRSFHSKSAPVKASIISAGVAMNLLLAVLLFYFLIGFSGFQSQQFLIFDYQFPFGKQQNFVSILATAKDSPAEEAGLQSKDLIVEGNGIEFKDSTQFTKFIDENKGKEIVLKVKNLITGEVRDIKVVPRVNPPENEGSLGVGLGDIAEIQYSTGLEKSLVGFLHSFNLAHYSIIAVGHLVRDSFTQRNIEPLSSAVVGPVGILAITKLTLTAGIVALLNLVALISLAFAIVNILPFPALDGGRLVLITLEASIKKKVPLVVERNINLIGFILLIVLLILVTYKDVIQFKKILF